MPGALYGPPTLVEMLRLRALQSGNDLAFQFLVDGETDEANLTFAELDKRARTIAAWLQARGMSGERALLLFPAGLDFIAAFFGCLYAGVIAVPAYPPRMNRKLDRIQAIAADAEAQVALTIDNVLERVQPLLAETPLLQSVQWLAVDKLPESIADDWTPPAISADMLAFLQYTSGSTGTPKGVMLSHKNLMHNCAMISHGFELTRSGSGMFWLPSYHDMGLVGGILQPIFVGRPNVLMSPMSFLTRPYRWLQAISRYRTTVSGGPNFAYDLCVRKVTAEQRDKLDLSNWVLAFNGAEPVRAETLDRFTEMFEPCGFRREVFYPCYGLAEATLLVSGGQKYVAPVVRAFEAKALENREVEPLTVGAEGGRLLVGTGQALLDQAILIVQPQTRLRCAPGEVGEIWVRGPSVAQGYWRRREETEHSFRARISDTGEGPFLRTGDLGFFDGSELFIAGRLKDLIIIRGLNHYPHDIELTVEKSHASLRPGCGAALSVDIDDEPRLVIVYEIERHQSADTDAVFAAIRREVSREHELPVDAIRLVRSGSIPKTSSGKIQRHACRSGFVANTLEVVAAWNASSSAGDQEPAIAEDIVAKVVPAPKLLRPTQ
ncbi:MAG TPA: fatty acyl-AMP ligase, partial [Pirellulales bacterium]|nr:fatty acyl-AMP ligase [Pirellulales bacterium]